MENPIVRKNHFGYYEVIDKPTPEVLKRYYAEKYYQNSHSTYAKTYPDSEITYFRNKLAQKLSIITNLIKNPSEKLTFLDIGAGEGWALDFFTQQGWTCTGLDYSEFGCKSHNPHCLNDLIVGDIYENITKLLQQGRRYHVILLDNVLEHLLEPLVFLQNARSLLEEPGILVIEVPNDFSMVQTYLLDNQYISRQFWVVTPDHLSYFNKAGLIALCQAAGWQCETILGDYPIDFSLFNENTNYVENKSVGKSCHHVRVAVENLLHSISPEKTNKLYEALADLGLGRQLIGFFKLGDLI